MWGQGFSSLLENQLVDELFDLFLVEIPIQKGFTLLAIFFCVLIPVKMLINDHT